MKQENSTFNLFFNLAVSAGILFVFVQVFGVILMVLWRILKMSFELGKGILIYLRWRIFDGTFQPPDNEVTETVTVAPKTVFEAKYYSEDGTVDAQIEFTNDYYDSTDSFNVFAISKHTVSSINLDAGDILMINTARKPEDGDLVVIGDRLRRYEEGNTLVDSLKGVVIQGIARTIVS